MYKSVFFIILCFLVCIVYPCITVAAFPPYYFSAALDSYPDLLDGETVRNYITFDYPSENTKFIDNKTYTPEHRKSLMENVGVENVPEAVYVRFGFTLKSVNMRMTPSGAILHTGNPSFDMNQYTRVGASAPVAVLHSSNDGKYYYVQTEFMRGWIPSESVMLYGDAAFRDILRMPFLRVVKDGTNIEGVAYSMGDKIPMTDKNLFGYKVLLPDAEEKFIYKSRTLNLNNETFSAEKIRSMADDLLGNPYDWGGKAGFRDCSSFVRDLWLVFGLNLPRNTSLQSGVGKEIVGKPASKKEFYDALTNATPFKTLIFFKGHVILYGGMEDGDYIVYHAVNRLSKDSGETQMIASVVKQKLIEENFSDIWKRVIKVTDIDSIM